MSDSASPPPQEQKARTDEADLFFRLTPEVAMAMVEKSGHRCTGYHFTLNSYENRVFEFELEGGERVITKFYRPGRWTREIIEEEHSFILELAAEEIPVGVPLELEHDGGGVGSTILEVDGIFCSAFKKIRGRSPEYFQPGDLERLGRLIGRVHNVGARREARHRPILETSLYGDQSLDTLLEGDFVPKRIEQAYVSVAEDIFDFLEPRLEQMDYLRLHGDCHRGNVLENKEGYALVDFDDMMMGPAVQDIWLFSPGRDEHAVCDRDAILEGYEQMRAFDRSELGAVEALRALRIVHYSAWIARRYRDPAFQRVFVNFRDTQYWEEELNQLREIAARLGEVL